MEGVALEEVPSAQDDHRYVIIGAGAVGGTVGAVLARAGIPTVLVARGRHAEVLATAGVTLRTPDGTFRTAVTAASRAEEVQLTQRDVLVFATKTQQLDAALREWVDQPVHGPHGTHDRVGTAGELLPAMTALNGVAAEEKALRYFGRVFGVCVWLPAVHLEPGEVIVRSWPVVGQFHIGRCLHSDRLWAGSLRSRKEPRSSNQSTDCSEVRLRWCPAGAFPSHELSVAPVCGQRCVPSRVVGQWLDCLTHVISGT